MNIHHQQVHSLPDNHQHQSSTPDNHQLQGRISQHETLWPNIWGRYQVLLLSLDLVRPWGGDGTISKICVQLNILILSRFLCQKFGGVIKLDCPVLNFTSWNNVVQCLASWVRLTLVQQIANIAWMSFDLQEHKIHNNASLVMEHKWDHTIKSKCDDNPRTKVNYSSTSHWHRI